MRPFPPLPDWLALEHEVAKILTKQEIHGWYFDERSAWQLASTLQQELSDLEKVLREQHPYVAGAEFTPKRDNKTSGYIAGATFTRLKELNPTSRDHISWVLQTYYGWTPTSLTTTGKPIVDENILTEMKSEISTTFARCLTVTKMLGMISNGVNAWLKLSTNNRIHHHCSVATNTHRTAARKPNLQQVPHEDTFRQLFTASPGLRMVGSDLSGIELRYLAHLLSRWDGTFADILINGDIHQTNADKIGVTRRQVKKISYSWMYGSGDVKLGLSFDAGLSEKQAKKKGAELRKAFVEAIPGMSQLLKAVETAAERGYVRAVDGRKIILDSKHKALNYICQSSCGVIARRWLYMANEMIKDQQMAAHQLAFIHDELQFECLPKHVDDLKFILEFTATQAGEYYNLRCPIAAEAKDGLTWADVH